MGKRVGGWGEDGGGGWSIKTRDYEKEITKKLIVL